MRALLLLLLAGTTGPALAAPLGPQPGLIRMHGTIAPGFQPDRLNIYLNGATDIYISEHVSLRGDVYYFVGEQQERSTLVANHGFVAGISYHFLRSRWDPFLSFQPGLAWVQAKGGTARVAPLMSVAGGCNFYVHDFFHFFGEVRQVVGQHLAEGPPVSLTEQRVSFGLGINFDLW